MRAHGPICAGLFVSALTLLGCNGDQPAATAPTAPGSYAAAHKTTTFSLSCTNAGTSTVANVTVIVSSTIVGHLAPLSCGDQSAPVSNFKSWEYQITLTNQANTTTNDCTSLKPKHGFGSVTCTGAQSSAVLTAQ